MPLCLAIIGTWEATSETILNASTSWEVLICSWVGVLKSKQGKKQLKWQMLLVQTCEKNKNCLELFAENISGRVKRTSD